MSPVILFLLNLFVAAFVHGNVATKKCAAGTNIILRSGFNKSWTPSRIEWTIMENRTFVAFFSGQNPKTDFYPPLKDRLSLNTTTGDLEIKDLRPEDSQTYTVRVQNSEGQRHTYKVTLEVYAKLPEPTIDVINSTLKDGLCWVSLRCSVSSNMEVKFDWSSGSLPHSCFWENLRNSATERSLPGTSERTAWCNPNLNVNITCSVNDSMSSNLSTTPVKCLQKEEIRDNCKRPADCKWTGPIFLGLFLGLVISAILYCFRASVYSPNTETTLSLK
ncbi:T-lymphocyte surface antigen Ly-9-like isoform X1 [Arapaima gigas]